jgi:hypothetical protein
MRIARVFPRRTKATPIDELAFYDVPGMFPPEVDEVHVSVTFTYDRDNAEMLAYQWERIAPVKIGGPGWITNKNPFGDPGRAFEPGMYLRPGYTITSRGCNNKCWFCKVWKRGGIKEYPIKPGWNVLDDNILLTSKNHFQRVCKMLKKQKQRAEFSGGLEAKLLTEWHIEKFKELRIEGMFFAYDTPDDYEYLVRAMGMFKDMNFSLGQHRLRCYVLIGWEKDTLEKALKRIMKVVRLGYFPMTMLYKGDKGTSNDKWTSFNRKWANPFITNSLIKESNG